MTRLDVYPITLEDCAKQWRADQDEMIEMKNRAAKLEAERYELRRQLEQAQSDLATYHKILDVVFEANGVHQP